MYKTVRNRVKKRINPVKTCKRCKGEFRKLDWGDGKDYVYCLDCRMALGEDRRGGLDLFQMMNTGVGYRLARGFSLIARGGDVQ